VGAHDPPDLCGLDIEGGTLPWSGGYTYLDRRVPILAAGLALGPLLPIVSASCAAEQGRL